MTWNVLGNLTLESLLTRWAARIGGTLLAQLAPARSASAIPANAAAGDFRKIVTDAAARYGVPGDLVAAVIQAESNFNPRAVSSAGAKGLMQLMDGTARSLGVRDSFDPIQNVNGGVRYLSQLLDRYGSVPLALAAYNAGPGAVDKYGGIPPYAETQTYVQRVLAIKDRVWEA